MKITKSKFTLFLLQFIDSCLIFLFADTRFEIIYVDEILGMQYKNVALGV